MDREILLPSKVYQVFGNAVIPCAVIFPQHLQLFQFLALEFDVEIVVEGQCGESFGFNTLRNRLASFPGVRLPGVLSPNPFLLSVRYRSRGKRG